MVTPLPPCQPIPMLNHSFCDKLLPMPSLNLLWHSLHFGAVKPHAIVFSPLIHPVQVPLQSPPNLQQINTPPQLAVICTFANGRVNQQVPFSGSVQSTGNIVRFKCSVLAICLFCCLMCHKSCKETIMGNGTTLG